MTSLERFLSNPKRREEFALFLASRTGETVLEVLKDMHRPSRSNVSAKDATRVVLAAETHDYQAGWHDCIRAMGAMTIPKKSQTPETMQPFDDDWVRTLMAKKGTPIREATLRKQPKAK